MVDEEDDAQTKLLPAAAIDAAGAQTYSA